MYSAILHDANTSHTGWPVWEPYRTKMSPKKQACRKKTAARFVYMVDKANSWGLKGALYRVVASTHTWDDYSVVGGQGEDFTLMGARYLPDG